MKLPEVLRNITGALDKAGISYMLTGSFASAYHGSPRTTQDIDMVIEATAEQLLNFVNLLLQIDYYVELDAGIEALRRQSMFNVVDTSSGWKVDLIIRKSRNFSEEEFRRRKRVQFEGNPLFIASGEDVVISKLEWAKQGESKRQIEDAGGVLLHALARTGQKIFARMGGGLEPCGRMADCSQDSWASE